MKKMIIIISTIVLLMNTPVLAEETGHTHEEKTGQHAEAGHGGGHGGGHEEGAPIQLSPEQIKQAFDKYAQANTVIICNGGVSAGDKDYILQVMQEYGKIAFHKVNIKPGFPLLFGQYNKALFFGLPGNPVSSFNNFCQFVIPTLRRIEGADIKQTGFIRAKLTRNFDKTHYRREFVRAILSYDPTIGFEVTPTGNQSSGRLTSVTQANCFIAFNETHENYKTGDKVNIQRFVDLLYPHLI
ncbi:MAG: molybdopterin-binding protein [Ghiorsea sp.]|nr:molybdopterin-binding protein [Ghiorsea sp.]